MNSPPTFSLLDEPWIQCQTVDNEVKLLSITELFDGSQVIQGLRGDSPAQDYAVIRVLLSVFWRAHHPESQVKAGKTFHFDEWFSGQLDATSDPDTAVLDYLDTYRDRFDLFHPTAPFMQVAGLDTQKSTRSPISRIVPEAEHDYFTMRAGAGRESLEFAEAARWLIYTQAYDYSGIKSGALGDSRVKGGRGYPIGTGWTGNTGGTLVVGEDFRTTLVLNTVQEALISSPDKPVWERFPDTAAARSEPRPAGAGEPDPPQGPNDLATWQSRRIRLFTDGERVTSVLVSNGDQIPDAGANILDDPMTPYRYSKNKSKKGQTVHYARPLDTGRTMWRSLEPLISLERDPGFDDKNVAPIRPRSLSSLAELEREVDIPPILDIHMMSVAYGPQSSSVATTISSKVVLPVALLAPEATAARSEVINTASATGGAGIALGQFAGNLLVAAGGTYEFQADPADGILAELEPRFVSWLANLDLNDLEPQAALWHGEVHKAVLARAAELLRGAGPKALAGRTVPVSPGSSATRVLSAGTAYREFQGRLRKILFLLEDPSTRKEPQS